MVYITVEKQQNSDAVSSLLHINSVAFTVTVYTILQVDNYCNLTYIDNIEFQKS